MPGAKFFPEAKLNYAENLLKKTTLIKNWSPIVEYSEK